MNLPEIELTEDGRCYIHDGEEYQRVTKILHAVLPPYLTEWAEQVGQEAMWSVLNGGNTSFGSLGEARAAIVEQRLTCEDEKNAGGDRGSALHIAIEAMIRTGSPAIDLNEFENPEHRLYAQAFAEWMLDYQPVFEQSEIRVVHPELKYAGTFDAIATLTARPKGARGPDVTGKRVMLDFKTNKGKKVYQDHLYQLAAYSLALEHWGEPTEASAVVALGPYGKFTGKSGPLKSYAFKVNHVEPGAFASLVEFYNVVQHQKSLNPLGRK